MFLSAAKLFHDLANIRHGRLFSLFLPVKKYIQRIMARTFSRYIWLIDTVRNNPNIRFDEISLKWENSGLNDTPGEPLAERTFHRHRSEIAEEFGIHIDCDKSTNSYRIGSIDKEKATPLKEWLLETISVENIVSESHCLGDRILFEDIPKGTQYLQLIIDAMKFSTELEMTYHTYWADNEYTTRLQPFFLRVFDRRWYVIGITERQKGQLRTFALDRIVRLSCTKNRFMYPEIFSPKDFCSPFFGIFHTEEKPKTVIIKATGNQQKFIRSLPLHSSQKEIETGSDYAVFSYLIVPTYDFEQELLSRADTVEVLAPASFREEIRNRLLMMLAKY